MAGHPQPFPPLSEGVIASYDYYDFASGYGYKTFYPCILTGPVYALTTETIYSETEYIAGDYDVDFDIEFKRACDIKGEVLVNVAISRYNSTGSPVTIGYTCTIYIRHWDGTTETQLGNAAVTASESIGTTEYRRFIHGAKITVAEKHFKAGDSLRVTFVMVKTADLVYTGFDPKGRTDNVNFNVLGAQSSIRVPFKLNN